MRAHYGTLSSGDFLFSIPAALCQPCPSGCVGGACATLSAESTSAAYMIDAVTVVSFATCMLTRNILVLVVQHMDQCLESAYEAGCKGHPNGTEFQERAASRMHAGRIARAGCSTCNR